MPPRSWCAWKKFSLPAVAMAGLPSLSIPCGLSEGLPVGLQLIGPQFSENVLFRVAAAIETQVGFDPVPERLR